MLKSRARGEDAGADATMTTTKVCRRRSSSDRHRGGWVEDLLNGWCDRLCQIFEKYRDEFKKTKIFIPLFTAKILAKNGALDYKDIVMSEKTISIKIGKYQESNSNEDLIYKTFDEIIQKQKHVKDFLSKQRNKYSQEMPEF